MRKEEIEKTRKIMIETREIISFKTRICQNSCYLYKKCEYERDEKNCPGFIKYQTWMNNLREVRKGE